MASGEPPSGVLMASGKPVWEPLMDSSAPARVAQPTGCFARFAFAVRAFGKKRSAPALPNC